MSVFLPSDVLAQFATNIELVGNASTSRGTFTRSGYRFTLDKEPDTAPDGLYFLDMVRGDPHLRRWGDGSQITDGIVTVRLLYGRPGGNAGGGDRQSVLRNAADDCSKLADVCENPANYGSSTSGIRIVTFDGFARVETGGHMEIWEARFKVQWQSDMDTDTVVDLTEGRFIFDGVASGTNQLIAFSTNSIATGSQAFCIAEWRAYRLDKTDTTTISDNIQVADALGGGRWIAEFYGNASTGELLTTVA